MTQLDKREIKREGKFYVYMLRCKHGTYYTGYTNNLEKRIKLHNSGRGAKYLRGRGPVKLVYAKEYKHYKKAVDTELGIKGMTHKEKEKLILMYKKSKEIRASDTQKPGRLLRKHGFSRAIPKKMAPK